MSVTPKPPQPPELLRFRTISDYYVESLRRLEEWAQIAAESDRNVVPEYADQLDRLRDEIRAGLNDHEMGTPAIIARVVAQLLNNSRESCVTDRSGNLGEEL